LPRQRRAAHHHSALLKPGGQHSCLARLLLLGMLPAAGHCLLPPRCTAVPVQHLRRGQASHAGGTTCLPFWALCTCLGTSPPTTLPHLPPWPATCPPSLTACTPAPLFLAPLAPTFPFPASPSLTFEEVPSPALRLPTSLHIPSFTTYQHLLPSYIADTPAFSRTGATRIAASRGAARDKTDPSGRRWR